MKYLIVFFFGLFVTMSQAQNNELAQIGLLVNSYEAEKSLSHLDQAEQKIASLFGKKEFVPSADAHYLYAKVMGLKLSNSEVEDPLAYSEKMEKHFSKALEMDDKVELRHKILGDVYQAKIKLMEIGNKQYEEKDYSDARAYYTNALDLNQLEVAYPRHVPVDTSLLFTSAVFASLAKENKAAIADFERLEQMDYDRKDLYDYLERLYREEGMEEKAEKAKAKKAMKYPEK